MVLAIIVGLLISETFHREPVYQEKTLSAWLDDYPTIGIAGPVREAILKGGPRNHPDQEARDRARKVLKRLAPYTAERMGFE